jgi:membrane protein implicated in regulation of membrane protease activity
MQITTNEKLIHRRGRLGTYASIGGIAVLAVGMFASFQGRYMWVALAALVIGFLLAQYGTYSLRRWGRKPRPDQALATAMKGFDDRYHFYAWGLPAPYVLLGPQGVYNFITRDQTGQVTVNGSQWRSKFTLGRALLFFAQEGLGNPTDEALSQASRLNAWIKSKQPDLSAEVQPVIVFIDERAQLQVNEPSVPVLDAKGLKKWMRGSGKGDTLRSADYRALEELFNSQFGAAK